VNDLHRARINK